MILFINLCISWSRAALQASYMEAETYGAEPSEYEAMRVAHIFATSGNFHHLQKIKNEFQVPVGTVYWDDGQGGECKFPFLNQEDLRELIGCMPVNVIAEIKHYWYT